MTPNKAPSVRLLGESHFVIVGEFDAWVDIPSPESRIFSIFCLPQEPSNIRSELDSNEMTQCSADEFVTTILYVKSTGEVKAGEILQACFRGIECVVPFLGSSCNLLSDSCQLSSDVVWFEDSCIEEVVSASIESRTQMKSPCESIGRLDWTRQVVDAPRGA